MNLSEEDVQLAYLGGRLHDIGKLWVDDHFLTKPGPLTPERPNLKTHTTAGYDLMNRFERLRTLGTLYSLITNVWTGVAIEWIKRCAYSSYSENCLGC